MHAQLGSTRLVSGSPAVEYPVRAGNLRRRGGVLDRLLPPLAGRPVKTGHVKVAPAVHVSLKAQKHPRHRRELMPQRQEVATAVVM